MKNKKKTLVIQLIIITISIITIIGSVSYAYFKAQVGSGAKTNVNVQSGTVDNLTFDKCSPISITMTQQNFGENAGNQEGSTCVKAILTANNTTNQATENYNVYLDIKENNFEYTTQEQKPEIILQVTDPNGNRVTSIPTLTYDTTLQGFDITTKKGLIQIASNYEIKVNNRAENPKTHEWQLKIIVMNLDSDQSANAGKSFSAEGIIQKDKIFPMYWDANYDAVFYKHPDTPNFVHYAADEISDSNAFVYVKTDRNFHSVCLALDGKEVCFEAKFWGENFGIAGTRLHEKMATYLGKAVQCWGDNVSYTCTVNNKHVCLIMPDGHVWCNADGNNHNCHVFNDGTASCNG